MGYLTGTEDTIQVVCLVLAMLSMLYVVYALIYTMKENGRKFKTTKFKDVVDDHTYITIYKASCDKDINYDCRVSGFYIKKNPCRKYFCIIDRDEYNLYNFSKDIWLSLVKELYYQYVMNDDKGSNITRLNLLNMGKLIGMYSSKDTPKDIVCIANFDETYSEKKLIDGGVNGDGSLMGWFKQYCDVPCSYLNDNTTYIHHDKVGFYVIAVKHH